MTVTPMTFEELDEAICEPAKQVGLEVERRLVTQMVVDVKDSAGSLPLLQFSLTALWQQWHQQWQQGKPGLPNQLTLNSYNELGGLKGTLEKQANKVFDKLSTGQQEIAKWIFIELTQLGEDAEDTRRQVTKYQLVETLGRGEYSEELVEEVIGILNDEKARLIVTSDENGVSVVDIVHEALIRHWDKLREWVNAEREAIKVKRDIEKAAKEWESNDCRTEDLSLFWLGRKLERANNFLWRLPLSSLCQQFIEVSKTIQDLFFNIDYSELEKPFSVRKLKYWRIVEEVAHLGLITAVRSSILDVPRFRLGILLWDSDSIESEVFNSHRNYESKIIQYQKALLQVVSQEFPLLMTTQKEFQLLQNILRIDREDIAQIEQRIYSNKRNFIPGNDFIDVTVKTIDGGFRKTVDIPTDMIVSEFISAAQEVANLEGVPCDLILEYNNLVLSPSMTFQDLGVQSGDVLILIPMAEGGGGIQIDSHEQFEPEILHYPTIEQITITVMTYDGLRKAETDVPINFIVKDLMLSASEHFNLSRDLLHCLVLKRTNIPLNGVMTLKDAGVQSGDILTLIPILDWAEDPAFSPFRERDRP